MRNIDLARVFEFPLTAVPLSLANVDGTMFKTPKSKFMHHLVSDHTWWPWTYWHYPV